MSIHCPNCGPDEEVMLERNGSGFLAYCSNCFDIDDEGGHPPIGWGKTRQDARLELKRCITEG